MEDSKRLKIIVVDDDPEIAGFTGMKLRLDAPHFEILELGGGYECIEYLRTGRADCIISDYQMPGMDGMELLSSLRESGDKTPFIFLTGQGTEEIARQAFINGAADYFIKDTGFAQFTRIINSIEQAVRRTRAEQTQQKTLDALKNTAEGVSSMTGETFFRSLVEYLARSLDVKYAFVGTLSPAEPFSISTVSVFSGGEVASQFAYSIAGTPCGEVVESGLQCYPGDVRRHFPDDPKLAGMDAQSYIGAPLYDPSGRPIGVLAVIDVKPIADEDLGRSLLRIFAVRAAAEHVRQRTDRELAESEAKFRGLVEGSMVGVVIVQDEKVVYCNPRYAGILGYTTEEVMAMPGVLSLVHPDDRAIVKENIRLRVSGEVKSITYQFRMLGKDGVAVDVEVHGSLTEYRGGPAVVASMIDITERKAAHEALVARNQELYALNGVAEVISTTHDLKEMLKLVLDKVLSMPFMNLEKKGVVFLVDEADPDTLRMAAHVGIAEELARMEETIKLGWCLCGQAAASGEAIVTDNCGEHAGHATRYPGMTPHGHLVMPIKSKDRVTGVITLYVEAGAGVTEADRRLIEGVANQLGVAIENHRLFDRIAGAKKEWEDTFDAIEDMVTIHDPDFRILRANRAVEKAFGMSESELIGRKCHGVFHSTGSPPVLCPARGIMDSNGTNAHYEYVQDGRHYQTSAYPIEHGGKRTALVHIVKDVTEQKKLEAKLYHSQKMESIGQLAGGIAHDYNNITATIMACANVLQLRLPEEDRLRTYVDQILLSTDRATRLTKGLLAFGRKQLISAAPVEVNALASSVPQLVASLVGDSVSIDVSTFGSPLTVMADRTQLEQVFMNLATNARDAMGGAGKISISTGTALLGDEFVKTYGYGRHGRFAHLSFVDSGKGIDQDTMGSIFEPFFTTKDVGKGTGLGLSIVYGIIKQHGGYINASSEDGRGTTFNIYLPLVNVPAEDELHGEAQSIPRGTETLLLAEDDEALRKITSEVLEGFGYNVIVAVDGADAWEKFQADPDGVSLLIIDVVMPNMNGKELYDRVKTMRPGVKTLFMSGYTDHILNREKMGADMPEILAKPAPSEEILRKVRELLDG